ncbi:MAG: hypothetical protein ACOCT8_01585 [Actinomycetota bacterium]
MSEVRPASPRVNRDRTGSRRRAAGESGALARALLWVVSGLAAVVVLMVLTAPELLGEPGVFGQLLLLVLAAGLPGLVVIAAVVRRRRRIDQQEH